MGSQAGGLGGPPKPAKEVVEKRTLVVGRGISVQGTVQDAERLVVEGTVEASMIHAVELHVAPGGVFRGEVQVEDVLGRDPVRSEIEAAGAYLENEVVLITGAGGSIGSSCEPSGDVVARGMTVGDGTAIYGVAPDGVDAVTVTPSGGTATTVAVGDEGLYTLPAQDATVAVDGPQGGVTEFGVVG